MSLRKFLQRNSAVTSAITLIVIVVALISIVVHFATSRPAGAIATEAYFTIDDGKSWFAEDINKLPPFSKGGKDAVRAYVFRCGSGKPWVAYLARWTPEGQKVVEDARAKAKAENQFPPDDLFMERMWGRYGEIKRPGEAAWISEGRDRKAYMAIMRYTCPDGTMDDIQMLMP